MEICNVDFCFSLFVGNAIILSLLYVHAKRTGRKIRPRPKPVILKIKMIQMIQILYHRRANQYELISDGKTEHLGHERNSSLSILLM